MLEEEYGLNATMVVHNFHPVPARPSDRNDDLQRKLRVIWVANFKGWKHPEVFVSLAEANKQNDDVEFVMIGMPGHDRHFAALHERIARLENLRYLGELSIEAVDDQIAASDIFVNTSDAEGFPNTFVQAWMCGVPVVSCHVDPDQCLSKHGAGILTGGSAGLAPAIESLRRDRERLRALSRAALAYGSANHGVEHAAPLIDLLTSSGGVARDAPAHDS
jgi:glycosyltransferase involved in cell wall biosynthesis